MSRIPRLSVFAFCCLVPLGLAGTVSAQPLAGRDAQCRYKVGNAARTYGEHLTQRIATCHQQRIKGKLPPAIDCNDLSTWSANGYQRGTHLMQKSIEKMTRIANSCHPVGGTPASVGYVACPAPCAAVPVASFDGVAACMRCLLDDCAIPAAEQIYGTVPLPAEHPERHCQQILGRKLTAYLTKRSFLESVCRFNQERGKPGFLGLDCTDLDNPSNPMHIVHRRAINDLQTLITNQCTEVDMPTELDTCGADPAAAITCLRSLSEACADSLYAATYPPVP